MLAKIAEDTQINKTMDFIPDKKTHGIWLAATNIVKTIQNIKEANISIKLPTSLDIRYGAMKLCSLSFVLF